jgi:hypothetical protein
MALIVCNWDAVFRRRDWMLAAGRAETLMLCCEEVVTAP